MIDQADCRQINFIVFIFFFDSTLVRFSEHPNKLSAMVRVLDDTKGNTHSRFPSKNPYTSKSYYNNNDHGTIIRVGRPGAKRVGGVVWLSHPSSRRKKEKEEKKWFKGVIMCFGTSWLASVPPKWMWMVWLIQTSFSQDCIRHWGGSLSPLLPLIPWTIPMHCLTHTPTVITVIFWRHTGVNGSSGNSLLVCDCRWRPLLWLAFMGWEFLCV